MISSNFNKNNGMWFRERSTKKQRDVIPDDSNEKSNGMWYRVTSTKTTGCDFENVLRKNNGMWFPVILMKKATGWDYEKVQRRKRSFQFYSDRKSISNLIKLTLAWRFMSIVVPFFVGVELFEAISTSVRHYVLVWKILNDQMMGEWWTDDSCCRLVTIKLNKQNDGNWWIDDS